MGAGDAHPAGFRVQPGGEGAERVDPAADAMLGLEDQRLVTLAAQLEGGDKTGQPAADHDYALGRLRPGFEALGRRQQHVHG